MPAQISGPYAAVSMLIRALFEEPFSYRAYNDWVAQVNVSGATGVALKFGAGFPGRSEDYLSTMVLTNLGLLPNVELQAALRDYLAAVGKDKLGVVALQLGQILSGLEDATGDLAPYAAAAVRWNDEVMASHLFSSNPAHTGPALGFWTYSPGTGVTLALTAGNDVLTGTAHDDVFLATEPGLLGSGDFVNGGGSSDAGNLLRATLQAGERVVPKVISVSKVVITAGGAAQFGLERSADIGSVWRDAAVGSAAFTGVNLATRVGIQNSLAGGALTVEFNGVHGELDRALNPVKITLADATGADEVIVPSVKNLSVASEAGSVLATTVNTARITADSAEQIVISGHQGLTTTVTGVHVEVINAEWLLGELTLAFSTTGATPVGIVGGLAADKITVDDASGARVVVESRDGADTVTIGARNAHAITLGGGADTLNIAGLAGPAARDLDIATDAALGRSAIRVADFESGVDMLKLTGATGLAKAVLSASESADITASASLLSAANLAATTAGAHKAVAFRYGADTFILVNDAAAALGANDSLIKLSGVSALADASWAVA